MAARLRLGGSAAIREKMRGLAAAPAPRLGNSSDESEWHGHKATAHPTITASAASQAMHVALAASNPLVPGAADIDVKLDMTIQTIATMAHYKGRLHGDAFPNAEVFVVNSENQATMLHEFSTEGSAAFGPYHYLPFDFDRSMGTFDDTVRE